MAKQKDAAKGGDGERSCEIIKAIGHTGLDLVISPSGSITTRVSTKPVTKRKSKRRKSSESGATEAAVEESAVAATSGSVEPADNKDAVNSGQHIVVKSENGKTTIHILGRNSSSSGNYRISNSEGQFISKGNYSGRSTQVAIPAVAGLYIVQIWNDNKDSDESYRAVKVLVNDVCPDCSDISSF
jgi:hypothetical protein